jgi:hypothetical protein
MEEGTGIDRSPVHAFIATPPQFVGTDTNWGGVFLNNRLHANGILSSRILMTHLFAQYISR